MLILVIGLSGCSGQQKLYTALTDYQQRMASVLELPPPKIQTISLDAYPSMKILQNRVPNTNILLAELYQIKNCQLATLIAERNTSLGRTQYPSTRYNYEVRLLQAIAQCLDNQGDQQVIDSLKNWQTDKQQKLPLVWANLVQTSSEMKPALSANQGFIQGSDKDGLNQTLAAFRYLDELRTQPKANGVVLEAHLANLQQYQLPARLWRSQMLLISGLKKMTHWLKQNENLLPCPQGQVSKKVEYLNNVFQLFFIEKIQIIASKLNAYHYQLAPLLTRLTMHPNIHPSFSALILPNIDQSFTTYQASMDLHMRFWQGLYKRCGLKAGS